MTESLRNSDGCRLRAFAVSPTMLGHENILVPNDPVCGMQAKLVGVSGGDWCGRRPTKRHRDGVRLAESPPAEIQGTDDQTALGPHRRSPRRVHARVKLKRSQTRQIQCKLAGECTGLGGRRRPNVTIDTNLIQQFSIAFYTRGGLLTSIRNSLSANAPLASCSPSPVWTGS